MWGHICCGHCNNAITNCECGIPIHLTWSSKVDQLVCRCPSSTWPTASIIIWRHLCTDTTCMCHGDNKPDQSIYYISLHYEPKTFVVCIFAFTLQGEPYSLTIPLGAISQVEKFGNVKNGANGYGFMIIFKVSR